MGPEDSTEQLNLVLDIFGQRLVTIFTQISLAFPTNDSANVPDIISALERGLESLAKHFPWLAGQVVRQAGPQGLPDVFAVRSLEPTPKLVVRYATDDASDVPSMEALRKAGFPMNMLREEYLAPRKSYSGRPGETVVEVFQVQATVLRDGIILTFLGQHQTMDGTGLAEAIQLFSKACRQEPFTAHELRIGSFAPESTVPLIEDGWEHGPELNHNIVKSDPTQPGPGGPRSIMPSERCSWTHFRVDAAAPRELKDVAMRSLADHSSYVSTDDALSAFVWQSITRARLRRWSGGGFETHLARAVDLRRYLNIPLTHPGFVQSMVYHKYTADALIDLPLGALASVLRSAIDPETSTLPYDGRSLATLIDRTEDRSTVSYIAGFDMSRDVILSSWANQGAYYDCGFGPGLSSPEAVRRPSFEGFPGLVYFLPRTPAGDINVVICLNQEDFRYLREDEDFSRFADCLG